MRTNLSEQFDETQRKAWKPKIIARNTFRYERDGETVIRLHATDIARKMFDGSVILNSGGWKTVTTKDRMNGAMPVGYCLSQERGAWFIVKYGNGARMIGATRVPYFDGIQVPQCFEGKPGKGAKVAAQEEKLRKQIRKFVSKLDGMQCLPEPSQGDCWDCCLRDAEGKTMGEHSKSDHILSHIKEGYLHGSLIMNALVWAGYRNPSFIWQLESSDRQQGRKLHNGGNVKRALKRYLYRQCGLVS